MDSKSSLPSSDDNNHEAFTKISIHEVSQDPTTTIPSRTSTYVDRWWLWEVSAWVVSFAALASMIGILGAVNNKPIPQWGIRKNIRGAEYSVSISINALLSIFATIMKTALIIPVAASLSQLKWNWFLSENRLLDYQKFEAASRGPLGSVILIWTLRGRRLACLGAFIIIAALALDFGFQQLVSYPVQPTNTSQTAQIPISTYYDKALVPTVNGTIVASRATGPEQSVLGDIYTGTFNYNGTFLSTPTCETGNCTWSELYNSLGMCGQCADVSTSLQKTCGSYMGTVGVSQMDDTAGFLTTVPANTTLPYCTYSLPNGLSISSQSMSYDYYGSYTYLNVSSSSLNVSAFGNIGNTVSVLSMLRPEWVPKFVNGTENPKLSVSQDTYGWIKSVEATQCSMYFCVKEFNGTVSQGKFTEMVVGTVQNDTASSIYAIDQNNLFDVPSLNLTINVQNRSQSSNFNISGYAYQGMSIPFDTWWDGNTTGNINAMVANSNIKEYSSYLIQLLDGLDSNSLNRTIENIAVSITNNIRTASNEFVAGQTVLWTPVVVVVWRWLALPVSLLVLALVFLLCTIVISSKEDAKLWKGNSLTSFYHPLSSEGRHQLVPVENPRQMEEVAQNLRVRWMQTEKGWRLVPGSQPERVV
ncbi:hypothetical protein LTR84_001848 [Exophiala bonariae]|uniref:Uncharacterized protein n=1 Tax=Exophiala bonariae TaxID=1690606 RepID=A0AAV9NE95_9EURO|nr:hypothetical protein LTR84_001848 [Exophiala bonariae]